ncbi:MAG: T9SS type A sorting domain-containing protein [Candidatus Cloacimonadaceae bacterium]|nr:T9SS type A sorting domain-containing protein [Candidatus Cloacimonadaceae bacterium]
MKKILLVAIAISMLLSIIYADQMQVGINKQAIEIPQGYRMPQTRNVPEYIFTKLPTPIITSYWDYMVGSYNGLPIRTIPASEGGGYFMTYTGRRQPTGTRRAYYTYLNAQGNVVNNNEITNVQNHEGYSTVAVDPISGKPLYAWHANADADAPFEVQFASDAFISGIAGLFNDIQIIADNPVTITSPSGVVTNTNEFIWPTAQIGPSPIAGKRRVYMAMRNFVSATAGPSENVNIAYADFSGADIENGIALNWSHTTIPEMNNWNVDAVNWRRPFHALTADNAGNIYYAGYHFAVDAAQNDIPEADMDVFMCSNYGQGTWTRISDFSNIPAWNPPSTPSGGPGYFTNANNVPYADGEISFAIANSSHVNAMVDGLGRIQVPAVWALTTNEGTYYPAMQYVKSFIYDPASQQYEIREIYPQTAHNDTFNPCFMPWDTEEPWGVAEYVQEAGVWYPAIVTQWPFPHWDATAHADAMMFHYNNIKMSDVNAQGMMVTVWQDSQRARWINYNSDTYYTPYANTPEIWISVSPDNGAVWSEPIVLNNVDTPQFAGIKPMWVYPSDKVIYTGMQGNQEVGKIGIMFYNDFTWGSNSITPPYHPTSTGGEIMFMELQIVFPLGSSNSDNTVTPVASILHQNYPNPFNPETTISFDMPKTGNANLSIYNVKGQLVKNLVNGSLGFGKHSLVWNGTDSLGRNVPSGLYFYRLSANGNTETKKMMLMK